MNKPLKAVAVAVVFGAIVLSTLVTNASDIVRGIDGSLSGLAIESNGPCGSGATLLQFGSHAICMDTYEASPEAECSFTDPQNELQTQENMQIGLCTADSQKDVIPWRFVSLTQAQQLCARDGKRLPTNEEWYKAASGITETQDAQ
jgi:hypothetical protein